MNFRNISLFAWRAKQYLRFLFIAKTKWNIHSPFVYDFVTQVLPHRKTFVGNSIEQIRKQWANSHEIINIHDLGAGYNADGLSQRTQTLAQVLKSSARNQKEGEFLFRLINHYKPQRVLEFGTNLGFSSAYLAAGLKDTHSPFLLTTVEGEKNLISKAQHLFHTLSLHANFVHASFEQYIENQKQETTLWDAIFLDGNHTYDATLFYFESLKPYLAPNAFIVLDDIYWSQGMLKAWKTLSKDPMVSISIDLFHFGILFFKSGITKQHFLIKNFF